MAQTQQESHLHGLAFIDEAGKLVFRTGTAEDPKLRVRLTDPEWLADAALRRTVPMIFVDERYLAMVTKVNGGHLVMLFSELTDTVLNFFTTVDFAFDIVDHILNDPYDAMAIIDAKARFAFIAPVHEKFFGLSAGEATGRPVRDVIENTRLHHVVKSGVAEVGQILNLRGSQRVVSRHPIRRDGKIVGAIGRIMFKGPQQVEALSRRVNMLEREIEIYKSQSDALNKSEELLLGIVGQSPAIKAVRDQIRKIAPLDIPVLIHGESGTGKELVAQALHSLSTRESGKLVTLNAAALPPNLVESELFGYEAGSFTGADKKGRAGKFEQADKGTIFLDEIGDMPIEMQAKLLRVLQDRVVERLGGDRPRKIDFRLISATNRDLEDFIDQGRFRLDLFFRISPVVITLPSLSERVEDIPLLFDTFLTDLAKQYGREKPEVTPEVLDYLMARDWPGNIRELRHVIERAFVFSEGKMDMALLSSTDAQLAGNGDRRHNSQGFLREHMDRIEREVIKDAMMRFGGNKKKVAEHLGVSRSYLYKKLEE